MKPIETGWRDFRAMTLPAHMPQTIADDLQIAFYAGALHVFATLTSQLGDSAAELTEDDLYRRANAIQNELIAFKRALEARWEMREQTVQ